jgi:hypothetical protein
LSVDCWLEAYRALAGTLWEPATTSSSRVPRARACEAKPTRIPLGPRGRSTDFVLPAFAVDPHFKNRLALAFYALTSPDCSDPRCRLVAGLATSVTGGKRWHRVWTSSPMRLGWLADTSQGQMVGDYFGLTFSGGRALALVVLARTPRAGRFNEALYAVSTAPR